ncbi:MAG TPA: peptide chain release factor N(5)-glutamine methyltransferase [Anaerolineae bacterium]|nr:peptide chain release factor N(5)-glutamine methyltransferase [Anaerolineae bacterium]
MHERASDVGSALRWATARLRAAGVDSPRLDAEILLAHVLAVDRAHVLAHPERGLRATESARYRQLIIRRARHEPVPYLVGHQEFYGLDFRLGPAVLIPRPETELLVEAAVALGCASETRPWIVTDVGTGCGAIAISLAVNVPHARVYAVDVSAEALAVAEENSRRHGVGGRVTLLRGHLLAPLPEPVDCIVANLPYVSRAEWGSLPTGIAAYEPRLALDGGPDGLAYIGELLASAGPYLRPAGVILLEIGAAQGPAVIRLAEEYFPRARVDLLRDYAGLDRVVRVQTAG